jgi:hypothetical protein
MINAWRHDPRPVDVANNLWHIDNHEKFATFPDKLTMI